MVRKARERERGVARRKAIRQDACLPAASYAAGTPLLDCYEEFMLSSLSSLSISLSRDSSSFFWKQTVYLSREALGSVCSVLL